jgi:CheY-like chemotaxis protein
VQRAGKVLLIDDDQDFKAAVRAVLEGAGYSVVEADCGKHGLRTLVEESPDLIVVDIMMATSTDGYGVTQSIKHRDEFKDYRHTPIIMVSSIEESPDDLFPMSEEVDMIRPDIYLTKPLDFPVFLETVRKVLAT